MLTVPMPANEERRLAALRELRILDTPPEDRFDRITRLAARLFAAPIALVSLISTNRQWFKSRHGLALRETPREGAFCAHTILGARPLVVPDALLDTRFADNPLVAGEPRARFYAGCPLSTSDGLAVGTLCVLDTTPRQPAEDELQMLADLARIAEDELNLFRVSGLQHRLAQETADRSRREQRLKLEHAVARVLAEAEPTEIVLRILQEVGQHLGWDVAVCWAIDARTNELTCAECWQAGTQGSAELARRNRMLVFPSGAGLPGRAWAAKAPVWVPDLTQPGHALRGSLLTDLNFRGVGFRGACAFPILVQGEARGVLEFFSRAPLQRDADLQQAILAIGSQVGQYLLRKVVEESLHESDHLYRSLVENIPSVVWIRDKDGTPSYSSPNVEGVCGYSLEEVLKGGAALWWDNIHKDEVEKVKKAYQGLFRGQPFDVEYRFRRKDQSWVWVQDHAVTTYQKDGVTHAYGVLSDVTDRKEAEEEMQQAKQAAEKASRAKSGFLANMSHEIRTPMTAILGFTDILCEEARAKAAPPEQVEALLTVKQNAEHLLTLMNDILDLSKVEAGKLEVELTSCSLEKIVSEVIGLMRVRAEAKGLPLEVEYGGPTPREVKTDPVRLRQILINLLGNAIKFTEVGSVRLRVCMAQPAGAVPTLQLAVVDTGIGLREEQLPHLFQPFTQGDASTSRQFGGTGLGLAISKRFAEMLGGSISVKSKPGQGSTFTLSLPAGTPSGAAMVLQPAGPAEPAKKPAASPLPSIPARVLLAEDGVDNQRLIAFHLRRAGADVTIAENGQAAVELAGQAEREGRPFAVVLMDMQMPVLDGYEATRRLREGGFRRPIIALTAHAMCSDRERCMQAGCDDYATKPIDRDVLIRTIAGHLSRAAR